MNPNDAPREFRARVCVNNQPGPGPGPVRVDGAGIDCDAGPAGPLRLDFGDLASLARGDLSVELTLFDGTHIAFDRGGSLDDLWDLTRARFLARVSTSLRFAPTDPRHTFDGRLALESADGIAPLLAQVSVTRLGLNYLSDAGSCAQIPFGSLGDAAFDASAYEVTIPVEPGPAARGGALLRLSKLARRTEEFLELYRQARGRSRADTARCLEMLAPDLATGSRMALAAELTVGRLVSRERFESLAPGGWQSVWDAAAGRARTPYREALQDLTGSAARLWLGLRPYGGVPPDRDGEAGQLAEDAAAADSAVDDSGHPVVYAAAILRGASREADRLAIEVLSETDHATYIYRVAPQPAGLDRDEAGAWLAAEASYTLLALDFKKEPLYLPEPEILDTREGIYRAALRRLPGLRELRARLAGRAIHSTPAAWLAQLEEGN
jgi:hypothetical protein